MASPKRPSSPPESGNGAIVAKHVRARLEFRSLKLQVNLGWGEEERAEPQDVLVDVTLAFQRPPVACESDDLAGTACYGRLADRARATAEARPYKLIERLAAALYADLREEIGAVSSDVQLSVRVTKIAPPVEDLLGGASFTYGDLT